MRYLSLAFILFGCCFNDSVAQQTNSPTVICFTVKVPTPPYKNLNSQICEYYQGAQQFAGNINVKYKIWRDANLDLCELKGDSLSIKERFFYHIIGESKGLGVQCGYDEENARQIVLSSTSKIGFNPDYSLDVKTKFGKIENPNRCKLSFGSIDITDDLNKLTLNYLNKLNNKFTNDIKNKNNFKSKVEAGWRRINEPISIDKDIWFMLNPSSLSLGNIRADDTNINVNLGITCSPTIIYGLQPIANTSALPKLTNSNCDAAITIKALIQLEEAELNNTLNNFKTNESNGSLFNDYIVGNRRIIIEKVNIKSSESKPLLITLKARSYPIKPIGKLSSIKHIGFLINKLFTTVKGKMIITGEPAYDSTTHIFSLTQTKYSLKTKNYFIKVFNGIYKNEVLKKVNQALTINLEARIKPLEKNITAGLNKDLGSVIITGKISHLNFDSPKTKNKAVDINAFFIGFLDISVK
ncbi:DUF4403 family protein [Spirosoma areae]